MLESDDEEAEMESNSETELDTESIQSVVPHEEEDMTVPIASEVEVPEARMSRAISEALVSLDTVDMGPFVLFTRSGDEESTEVPPWCVSCNRAHRFEGNQCRRDVE